MITGKLINLRVLREGDLTEFTEGLNTVMEVGDYFPLTIRSITEVKKKFNDTGYWDDEFALMLIVDKRDKMLGYIASFKSHIYFTGREIGYRIFKNPERGKGYMSEALRLFTAYIFDLKEYPRLYLTTVPGNTASRRVAEKGGFKYDGTLRRAGYNLGEYCDLDMFSLMKEDCPHFMEVIANH